LALLRNDADVREFDASCIDAATDAQAIVMAFEAAQSLHYEYCVHRDALSAQLAELIETGRRIRWADYIAALDAARGARRSLRAAFESHDVLLSPSAPGEAPKGLEATGDPIFNRGVTMLGLPAVTLPASHGEQQMPLGVQLIGGWDRDRELLAIARWIHTRLHSDL